MKAAFPEYSIMTSRRRNHDSNYSSYHTLGAYQVLGTVSGALQTSSHLILSTTLGLSHHYAHFMDDETEARKI